MEKKDSENQSTRTESIFAKAVDGKRKGDFYKANATQGINIHLQFTFKSVKFFIAKSRKKPNQLLT
jgi:hypothetical protein